LALTSSSTYADAIAQYDNNLAWDGDITKARLALEAIRWLLVHRPSATTREGHSLNYANLDAERKALSEFCAARGTEQAGFVRARARLD
jgi:hypothetical protein